MELIAQYRSFGGWVKRYRHWSEILKCSMVFGIYLPPQAEHSNVPLLYWLSGLTCTDENFMQKAGAQRAASEHGIAIVCPDTSPRGCDLPDEDKDYDLGTGAGFYLNATQMPWAEHYKMYDYIKDELPRLLMEGFPLQDKSSISGHSMGGHGALVLGLSNPDQFESMSAFAPICCPSQCPWGIKAFSQYLGDDRNNWKKYDASTLIELTDKKLPLLIDQGMDDEFLTKQLKLDEFMERLKAVNYPVQVDRHDGYDHSYFFIASFIDKHISFHAKYLKTV